MPDETKTSRSFSRRDFLKMAGSVAAVGLAGFILLPPPTFPSALPPGARAPLDRFRALCDHCGRCAAVCPHRAIRLNGEGLPYIDGLSGWCDFCLDCARACPTGALSQVDPTQVKLGLAVIDRDRCLAWKWSGCRLCYEKCVVLQKAIYLDTDWRPHIDRDRCNGCAACVNVCPQSDRDGKSKQFGRAVALKADANGS